jgi:hypothetical protein
MDNLADILKRRTIVKPPAYEWQDFALRVIKELGIPDFKRSAVFKICRDQHKNTVEKAMNETKELCQTGSKWQYFFKVIASLEELQKKTKAEQQK